MNEEDNKITKNEDGEINIIDLLVILLHRKKLIITITVIAIIGVLLFSIISLVLPPEKSYLPNEYTPRALMLINEDRSSGGGLAAMLGSNSGLGALAGLAGVSTGGSTFNALAVYLVGTNTMLDTIVDEFDLIKRYKIKESPRAESRMKLRKNLKADFDTKSGVLSLSFTDIDPAFAQKVVNFSVGYLERRFDEMGLDKNKLERDNLERNIDNTFKEIQKLESEAQRLQRSVATAGYTPVIALEATRIELELAAQRQVYTQLKIQYELLKVTMASEKPVFQVLEYAEIPDRKSGPSRGMLVIIVTLAAGFFAVFLAFVLNFIETIKRDKSAMAKLRGKNDE